MINRIEGFCSRQYVQMTFVIVVVVAITSFWGFLKLHFMYDDWGMLWLARNDWHRYLRFVTLWPGGSHPALIISFFPWAHLLGTNPIYYNLFGLVLKIISALSFGYLTYVLTKSKIYFLVGGVLYASSFIGIEAFSITSTRSLPYVIIFLLLSLAFYIRSLQQEKNSLRHFIFSVIFLFLASLSDPVRVLPFPLISATVGIFFSGRKWLKRDFLVKSFLLFFSVFIGLIASGVARGTIFPTSSAMPTSGAIPSVIKLIFDSREPVDNFFKSIGFLLSSYVSGNYGGLLSLLARDPFAFGLAGVLVLLLISVISFRIYRREKGGVLLALFLGILLMYFPNWLFYFYSVPGSHRYLALSGVFFLLYVIYLLYLFGSRRLLFIATIILLLVHFAKNFQISNEESRYRDYQTVENIYQKMENAIPKKLDRGLFMFEGPSILVGNQLVWSAGGTIPFSFKRNITRFEDMPSFTSDYNQAVKMICPGVTTRIVVNDWIAESDPIPLSSVFGFRINENNQLEDETAIVRKRLINLAPCLHKNVN